MNEERLEHARTFCSLSLSLSLNTLFTGQRERERERESEKDGERERERCPELLFLFLKEMMGALAHLNSHN
jgi:hypothetical protein